MFLIHTVLLVTYLLQDQIACITCKDLSKHMEYLNFILPSYVMYLLSSIVLTQKLKVKFSPVIQILRSPTPNAPFLEIGLYVHIYCIYTI